MDFQASCQNEKSCRYDFSMYVAGGLSFHSPTGQVKWRPLNSPPLTSLVSILFNEAILFSPSFSLTGWSHDPPVPSSLGPSYLFFISCKYLIRSLLLKTLHRVPLPRGLSPSPLQADERQASVPTYFCKAIPFPPLLLCASWKQLTLPWKCLVVSSPSPIFHAFVHLIPSALSPFFHLANPYLFFVTQSRCLPLGGLPLPKRSCCPAGWRELSFAPPWTCLQHMTLNPPCASIPVSSTQLRAARGQGSVLFMLQSWCWDCAGNLVGAQ